MQHVCMALDVLAVDQLLSVVMVEYYLKRHITLFRESHFIFPNVSSFLHTLMTNSQSKSIPRYHTQNKINE